MKYFYLLPVVLLLHACGGNTETTKEQPEESRDSAIVETPVEDSVVTEALKIEVDPALLEQAKPADKKLLIYFFGKNHAAELLSAMQAIDKIKTDVDLHTCFHYVDSIASAATDRMNDEQKGLTDFYDHIDSINKLFESVSPLLPYIEFGCEAECSRPAVWVNYGAFTKLSKTTTGEQDDQYFDFIAESYGGGIPTILSASWFDMTWDYGGNSLLGAGDHYKTLKLAQDIKTGNVFVKEIEYAENICLDDALTWTTLFHTAEKAIGELKMIMKLDIGIKNKKKFEERIKKLQSPDKNMQLDCEHNDCQYG